MNAVEVLRLAEESGVRLDVAGVDLILDADREPAPQVLEAIRHHKADIVALLTAPEDHWTASDWRVFYSERAGIAEFDGHAARAEAEPRAYEWCVAEWMIRNPAPSAPGCCAWCGEPDNTSWGVIVPFWTGTHGHTWLHHGCWEEWYREREAQAVHALAGMGITLRSHVDQT